MLTEVMTKELAKIQDFAWCELSSEIAWNEELLEKFKDKVNWQEISNNDKILWTPSMLEKFREYIDWGTLSGSSNVSIVENYAILEQFKNDLNWHELTSNYAVSMNYELIDRFADLWDWGKLIDRYSDRELYSMDFIERYKDRIPFEEIQETMLWSKLVDDCKKTLRNSILQ